MSETTRARPRTTAPKHDPASGRVAGPAPAVEGAAPAHGGPTYAAGPLVGLGGPVQPKLAIGQAGDAFEREASAVASRVAAGGTVGPGAISPVGPGAVARAMDEQKKPEPKPVQKADAPRADEKKPPPPVQKAEAPKPEEEKSPPPVQKAEAAKPEEKKPETTAVQKAEAAKPEEKKPETSLVQKAEAAKPEEKKPETALVQKADVPKVVEAPVLEEKLRPPAPQPADAPTEDLEPDVSEPVQRAEERGTGGAGRGTPAAAPSADTAGAAEQAIAHGGAGRPLQPTMRRTLESRMGAELGDVRVHDDPTAQEASRDVGARAFTHGRDIWLGPGESENDVELMAHEATHVVQQGGGIAVQRQPVQRLPSAAPAGAPDALLADAPPAQRQPTHRDPDDVAHVPGDSASGADAAAAAAGPAAPGAPRGSAASAPSPAGSPAASGAPATGGGALLVQRAGGTPVPGKAKLVDAPGGKTLELPQLKLPTSKVGYLSSKSPAKLKRGEGTERPTGADDQRTVWDKAVRKSVEANLPTELKKYPGFRPATGGASEEPKIEEDKSGDNKSKFYFLEIGSGKNYLIGTPSQLVDQFVIPRWGPTGEAGLMDVDHKEEVQLGGSPGIENLHLLDASANRSSGARISNQLRQTIGRGIAEVAPWPEGKTPDVPTVRQQYNVDYASVVPDRDHARAGVHWDQGQVERLEPLQKVKALDAKEVKDKNLGLIGNATTLVVYPLASGGKPKPVPWKDGKPAKLPGDNWIKGLTVEGITYEPGAGGTLTGKVQPKSRGKEVIAPKDVSWTLADVGGMPYTAAIQAGLLPSMRFVEFKPLSPIEFQSVTLDDERGIQARGKLKPSLPIFKQGLGIEVFWDGNDVGISATFTKDDFAFPGPIQVTAASITLTLSTGDLKIEGDVYLEIQRVGKGKLSAGYSMERGVLLNGEFEFDSRIFKPAAIKAGYADGVFSASGKLGIPPGTVRGIDSAEITAAIEGDKITASGTVKPSIPGVEQAALTVRYSEKEGLAIGGELQLRKDIPGLAGGSVTVEVAEKPGADRYAVKASGQATPKIPGVSASLAVTYDDGAFDASGTAGYEKGMLKGSVTVGATNRPVDADGRPTGPPADKSDKITIYGGGSVTLRLAPWLQGTAAIKLKPNGEIEVTGQIALPSSLDIVPGKDYSKNIFTIGIDIPIVGVAVAGQRIGIFANISGGLDLGAGIGPVQLQQLSLSVTYNPDHEDQTRVAGGAMLHVPAHAGLRLFVRGSIGVGIPIVSAQAGLEIGAQLGLEGALNAGVQVEWTPARGLKLDAAAELFAEPKLKFDLTGFVLVEADLFITTVELYSKRWQLAGFELGSGLRLGMKFPVHYEEGKPFEIALSDVQFQVPDINPSELLPNLLKQIA
jgi:hypothetical protein